MSEDRDTRQKDHEDSRDSGMSEDTSRKDAPDSGQKPGEHYQFIEEQVLPNRKKRTKHIMELTLLTLLLAVIFGLVSGMVFSLTGSYVRKQQTTTDSDNREAVNIVGSDNTGTETQTANTPETTGNTTANEPTGTDSSNTTSNTTDEEKADAQAKENYIAGVRQLSKLAAQVNRSIVTVTAVENGVDWFLNDSEKTSSTCGLIYADNKVELLILVNLSRVQDASEIRVTFQNGTTVIGTLYDQDATTGLAVVAVEHEDITQEMEDSYTMATLGDPFSIASGEPVLALGSPNGYLYSMEPGIVTNKKSFEYVTDGKVELFNLDIADNANGDGVIVNMDGEVLGLITHTFKSNLNKNICTVLSLNSKLKTLIQDLANKRERTYLGIVGAELTEDVASTLNSSLGIYVTDVVGESPAYAAGIQRGDVITAINDVSITNFTSFETLLRNAGIGKKVRLSIIRTTKDTNNKMEIEVTLTSKK